MVREHVQLCHSVVDSGVKDEQRQMYAREEITDL